MFESPVSYTLALHYVKGIGPVHAQYLIRHFKTAKALFEAPKEELSALTNGKTQLWQALHHKEVMQQAIQTSRHAYEHDYQIIHWEDDRYPNRLKNCRDAPIVLFGKGNQELNPAKIVSIVGTRNATPYGRSLCKELVTGIQSSGALIVSGLAIGIDRCAHHTAVEEGLPTIGILGHGLDVVYPPQHQQLVEHMCLNGGVLTEFPWGTAPDKRHFPIRNRIIAGISDVTVVVEAAKKGGALITAHLAHGYQRELAAFPGRTDQPYSEGCNALIVSQQAAPIRHAQDLFDLMNWSEHLPVTKHKRPFPTNLTPSEKQVVELLLQASNPVHIQVLQHQLRWSTGDLAMQLLQLELKKIIVARSGGYYTIQLD